MRDIYYRNHWTETSQRISAGIRHVVFEKYNPQYEIKYFILSIIDGCTVYKNNRFSNCIFYVKYNEQNNQKEILFEIDELNKKINVNYSIVWTSLAEKFTFTHVPYTLLKLLHLQEYEIFTFNQRIESGVVKDTL